MYTAILALHIIVAISMIGLILIQHGKGADAGASFGAGGAGTVFGANGAANFLTRTTAVMTAIFFITSLTLGYFAKQQSHDNYRLDTGTPTEITKTTQVNNPVAPTTNTSTTATPAPVATTTTTTISTTTESATK